MYSLNYQKPTVKKVVIDLPTSKSISNRALILNALLSNKVELLNLSRADDTQLMIRSLLENSEEINLDNAGTCMRFLTAYFCAKNGKNINLLGNNRMKQRPIKHLVNALKKLGAKIEYLEKDGYPPLRIIGQKLIGKTIEMNASESSQFITAIMLIAPFIQNGVSIQLKGKIASFDYIKMTALLMNKFGLNVVINQNIIEIAEYKNPIFIQQYAVEKDWSSAAFWYLIALLNGNLSICINDLSLQSIQGDKITAQIFEKIGVISDETNEGLVIKKVNNLPQNLSFNLINCIDLAPALCVACAALNVNVTIHGLKNLVIKESNRLIAIVNELKKLGYHVTYSIDSIIIHQIFEIDYNKNVIIKTYNDHRIAMAFAPLAMLFKELKLDDIKVVSKSYPSFFLDLEKVGIFVS